MPAIDAGADIFQVLHLLSLSPEKSLRVVADGIVVGAIDSEALIASLCSVTNPGDDDSLVTVECNPEDFSASLLAHAVEDADAHLTDMLSSLTPEGRMRVTLRIHRRDPAAAIRSLERYGYNVVDATSRDQALPAVLDERLAALQVFLNV